MKRRASERAVDWLLKPSRMNEKDFFTLYIDSSERLWSLADQDQVTAIETLMDQGAIDIPVGEQHLIQVYGSVSGKYADLAKDRIDKLLRENTIYAGNRALTIPDSNNHLTIAEYYDNYNKAKIAIIHLGVILGK